MPDLSVEEVEVSAYGPADIEAIDKALEVAPNAAGEVGFLLEIGEGAVWPQQALAAAVTFRLEANAPWNIRESEAGAYAYASTADRRHVVIRRDATDAALIYTAAPADHRFSVESAVWCADISACPPAPNTMASGDDGAVTVAAYGPAVLSNDGDGLKLDSEADAEIGFRIGLNDGVRWPAGAEAAAVRFRLESDNPWTISETYEGKRAYFSTETRDFVRLTKAQAEQPLIYARAPGAHRLFVDDIVWCRVGDQRCTKNSVSWRRLRGKGAAALYWEPFQSNAAERKGDGIIAVRSPADGAAYGVRLAPLDAGDERVVIAFDINGDVPVTLRRRRDGVYAYFGSVRGFVVLDAADRALLYSEKAGAFEVKIRESFSCSRSKDWRCRTKEEFLALLPPEREPGSIEGMLDLLAWATRNSDYAGSNAIVTRFSPGDLSAHQIYFKFLEGDFAAGYCAAQAIFLSRLLRERGYRAFTLNFGVLDDDLTHVTTIVSVADKYFLVDSTFGFYLADKFLDSPLNLLDAIDGAAFQFKSFEASQRDFLFFDGDPKLTEARRNGEVVECSKGADGVVRCDRPAFGARVYFETWSAALVRNGLPPDERAFLELLRRGFFGVDRPDWPETQRFVAELLKRGIPFVPTDSGSATAMLVGDTKTPTESAH